MVALKGAVSITAFCNSSADNGARPSSNQFNNSNQVFSSLAQNQSLNPSFLPSSSSTQLNPTHPNTTQQLNNSTQVFSPLLHKLNPTPLNPTAQPKSSPLFLFNSTQPPWAPLQCIRQKCAPDYFQSHLYFFLKTSYFICIAFVQNKQARCGRRITELTVWILDFE